MPYPYDPQFAKAEAMLRKRRVSFRRVSKYQLKIGRRVSYYPGTGCIFADGEDGGRDETGLAALEAVLRQEGILREPTPARILLHLGDDETC